MSATRTRTWPDNWESLKRGDGCPFCSEQPYEPFFRGRICDGYLERKAVALGHSILIFRERHAADFTELTPEEVSNLWMDVQDVGRLVRSTFRPCHLNFELLGNAVPHIHVHVLPRYLHDVAPRRPLPWEPTPVAEDAYRQQHHELSQAASALRDRGSGS